MFDEALKSYFADRHFPPPEVRKQVSEKLNIAAKTGDSSPARWVWGVVLYNLLVSAALIYALRLFLGPSIIVYVVMAYVSLSVLATIIIVVFSLSLQARKTVTFDHTRG